MKKTPEEIMTEFANNHSYNDWGELMYDSHDFYQISCTKEVMIEFAKEMAWKLWQMKDDGYFYSQKESFDKWWNNQMSEMTKMTKNN